MNYLAINKVAAAVILLQLSFCLGVGEAITTGDVCLSWHSSPCVGGDRGLTSTAVELSFKASRNSGSGVSGGSLLLLKNTTYNMTHSLNYSVVDTTSGQLLPADVVRFMFTQYEHGGGNCNCVDVYFDSNCSDHRNRLEIGVNFLFFVLLIQLSMYQSYLDIIHCSRRLATKLNLKSSIVISEIKH